MLVHVSEERRASRHGIVLVDEAVEARTRLTNPDRHETTKPGNHETETHLGFRGFVVSCFRVIVERYLGDSHWSVAAQRGDRIDHRGASRGNP